MFIKINKKNISSDIALAREVNEKNNFKECDEINKDKNNKKDNKRDKTTIPGDDNDEVEEINNNNTNNNKEKENNQQEIKNKIKSSKTHKSAKENSSLDPNQTWGDIKYNNYIDPNNKSFANPTVKNRMSIKSIGTKFAALQQSGFSQTNSSALGMSNVYSTAAEKRIVIAPGFSVNDLPKQSTISQVVADSITKKIIMIILFMLAVAPLTNEESYDDGSMQPYVMLCEYINGYINMTYPNVSDRTEENLAINSDFNYTIERFLREDTDMYFPIKRIEYNNNLLYFNYTYANNTYRIDEELFAFSKFGLTEISYLNISYTRDVAIVSIIRTLYMIFIVWFLATKLENDSKQVILEPLQVMIDVVQTVAKDPVNAKNIDQMSHTISASIKRLKKIRNKKSKNNNDFESQYEVQIIQLAIIKISALLAVSFGEAGGEIIKENISSSTELNPLIKGKKKQAIFGFCDIRKFSDINQALQEKTMVFVNEVAEIVHSAVDRFGGSTNKNIGDVFLMVWRKSEREFKSHNKFHQSSYTADQSLLAYLYCIQKINKSFSIAKYKYNEEIIKKLGNNFKVSMGFGLHCGWGIEGAIGSFYKIDASYLSPNVNIAARLMAATKQYKVPILISNCLYDSLSPEMQQICRKIDVVQVKGSKQPLGLYTVDVNMNPKIGKAKDRANLKAHKKYLRMKKDEIKKLYVEGRSFKSLLTNKKNFKELLKVKKGKVFYETFAEGLELYIQGKWKLAGEKLEDCNYIDDDDGPTQTLLSYMKKRDFICPPDWDGCRKLTSK